MQHIFLIAPQSKSIDFAGSCRLKIKGPLNVSVLFLRGVGILHEVAVAVTVA